MRGFSFAILAVLLVACLYQSVQGAESGCTIYGKTVKAGETVDHKCAIYTCNEDGSFSGKTCAEYQCQEQIGYREQDDSKPYPECCGGPICKE